MIKHAKVPDKWDMEVDLVSVGSSSGGLTAAIVGHDLGLSTVVLEKGRRPRWGYCFVGGCHLDTVQPPYAGDGNPGFP